MRLHLIGFPHTHLNDEFSTCAYSQKNAKFARMGWDDLVVYANEESVVPDGVELVPIFSEKQRREIFGKNNPKKPPEWPTDEQWKKFNEKCALAVAAKSSPKDLLLLAGGWSQVPIANANPHLIACEPGVGYEGVWANFIAFESYAWQHHVYAKKGWDGRWFDRVIPNYFDLNEFPVQNEGGGDFLLFIGRVVQRKGLHAAMDIAKACKMPLKVAGPGPTRWKKGKYIAAPEVTINGNVEYLGVLGPKERNEVMAKAAVTLVPTVYVEPFGGVAIESMLSGTPVVATDWGAFTETVTNGVTGFRFRTLSEAVEGVKIATTLNHDRVRIEAARKYSLENVKPHFDSWFWALDTLHRKGWYEL